MVALPRLTRRGLLVLALLAAGLHAIPAQTADDKKPPPEAQAQKRALELIRDVYGKEWEDANTPAKRVALAKKLLDQADKSKNDPAAHFVLLGVARDIAARGGDVELALACVDRLAAVFQVDVISMKVDCLTSVGRAALTSSQRKGLAEKALGLIDVAVAQDKFEAAKRLGQVAIEAARRTKDYRLVRTIAEGVRQVDALQKAWVACQEALKVLDRNPGDPEANLTAGRYSCLVKGDWARGVPMLALGSDAALKGPAVEELKGPTSADEQVDLGDDWWDLAQKAEGRDKDAFRLRAGHWYRRAQPNLASALLKAKVEKRLEEIAKTAHPPTVAAAGRSVQGWDVAKTELLRTLVGHTGRVWSVAFSPDGRIVASAGGDKTIGLWNAATGRLRGTLAGHTDHVRSVAFSPDGKLLASASHDKTIKLWDTRTGRLRGTLAGHTYFVLSVAFSPDGKMLVSGGNDKTVRFWDLATGQLGRTIDAHQEGHNGVHSVAFNADGSVLASGNGDGTVKLWDVATGQLRATLPAHTGDVACVAFSPDGKTLVSGGVDKTIRVWDVATGESRAKLVGHTACVPSVAFSRDGKVLASGSDDNTIGLWDVAAGQLQRTLTGHAGTVHCVAFSPDGRILISGSEDKTIKLWGRRSGGRP